MFTLNIGIKTGDILLIRGSAKHSKVISAVTRGQFSHACLVLDGVIIESITDGGVQYSSAVRFVFKEKLNILVLRPKFLLDDNQAKEIRNSISNIAQSHLGRGYNSLGALMSVLGFDKQAGSEKYFCSQLVARIFSKAGYPLFEKEDHHVVPNDFARSSSFEDITDFCIGLIPDHVKARIKRHGEQLLPLDDGYSSASATAITHRTFLGKAESIFAKYNLKPATRMPEVILTLTDPKNFMVAAALDKEITSLYDSMNINEEFRVLANDGYDDIDELREELTNLGEDFALTELNDCMFLKQRCLKKLELDCQERAINEALGKKFNLKYALRLQEYSDIAIQCENEVIGFVDARIELIVNYLDALQPD